jgi:hypothetical protein
LILTQAEKDYPHLRMANPAKDRKIPIINKAIPRLAYPAKIGPSIEPARMAMLRIMLYQARYAGQSLPGVFSSK